MFCSVLIEKKSQLLWGQSSATCCPIYLSIQFKYIQIYSKLYSEFSQFSIWKRGSSHDKYECLSMALDWYSGCISGGKLERRLPIQSSMTCWPEANILTREQRNEPKSSNSWVPEWNTSSANTDNSRTLLGVPKMLDRRRLKNKIQ
jgi:hypothetical protein